VSLTPPTDLARLRFGEGSPLMLVHGGAGPELTWAGQLELAARWTVIVPWRRGFVPSPKSVRQDFEIDAVDIEALLDCEGNAHLVGFSYGQSAQS
jgi:pimeloyl-ACP methyl ester carboxylesterase